MTEITVTKCGTRVNFAAGKDFAELGQNQNRVEFCFNWCKRFPKCGLLFYHFCSGERECVLCQLKHHVQKPRKITGIKNGKYTFAAATKEESRSMLFSMPKKESGEP